MVPSPPTPPPPFHAFNLSDGSQQLQQSITTPPPIFPAFNPSDPATVAALHLDFRQLSLASHLTKATMTAILQDLGQNCFISKLAIKAPFRNIPVHPSTGDC